MATTEPAATAGAGVDLDHTSFAVRDALSWARLLREEHGATPIGGETLPEFRYLLLHVGTSQEGARMELMEPLDPGFLTRYLAKHGAGPHHVTFTVPDLPATVDRVRSLGATVVGESYEHPPWREAFIAPDATHGVVIQLAQSTRAYPGAKELLESRTRDPATLPSIRGAVEPLWWTSLWETAAGPTSRLGTTHLASTDPAFSRDLFGDVLGGRAHAREHYVEYSWPSGSVRVHLTERPGVRGMSLRGAASRGVRIGSAWLCEQD